MSYSTVLKYHQKKGHTARDTSEYMDAKRYLRDSGVPQLSPLLSAAEDGGVLSGQELEDTLNWISSCSFNITDEYSKRFVSLLDFLNKAKNGHYSVHVSIIPNFVYDFEKLN